MATGSITSLGLGSELGLQDILDKLKEVDQGQITVKKNKKTDLQNQVDDYNGVNAKLFAMKADALNLSLQSSFIENSVSVSDEDILTATANDGIKEASFSLEVTQKAQRNSWQTVGFAKPDSLITAEPVTGITDVDAAVTTVDETMTITYGPLAPPAPATPKTMDINLTAGMSLTEIAEAVNTSSANKDTDGNLLVTASVVKNSDDEYYIRLSDKSGGTSADSQITVAGFDYVKADKLISIAQSDTTTPMYLSLAPGATYEQAVNQINSASDNPGVTAAIVNTGDAVDPYRMTLTADDTGEDSRITISDFDMDEVSGAGGASLNSTFTLNGILYQRQTNDGISDVIPGVTLNFKKAGESTVTVKKDMSNVRENIVSLVEKFNDLLSDLTVSKKYSEKDSDSEESEKNSLAGSISMKRLSSDLKSLLGTSIDTDSDYSSLFDIGLEINRDGTITLDEKKLDTAIDSDPEAIASLFLMDLDTGAKGLGDIFNDGLLDMVSSHGIVGTEKSAAETRIKRLDTDILTSTQRLEKKYETMAKEFARLDSYISSISAQKNALTSMIDSFNKDN
ncbi:MAG: flagellar filament capping protein FliD [Desulfobacteraceae bacterium]|nr:flagellar filament capping protein FliD [Desulfobacteraceae bacterium]